MDFRKEKKRKKEFYQESACVCVYKDYIVHVFSLFEKQW
jgi:hypothetical protein